MAKKSLSREETPLDSPRRGVIYILMNPFMPDLVKIGRTRRTANTRAVEISRSTGVPADFHVVYDAVVSDCIHVEKLMHEQFASRRVNESREFFRVSPKEAIDLLHSLAERFSPEVNQKPMTIEVLPQLEARMRRWIKREVVGVRVIQYPDLCLLEITEQPRLNLPDTISKRIDMDMVGDYDLDQSVFDPAVNSIEENVRRLLTLDVYSMLMVGFDFISHEAGEYIAEIVEKYGMEPPHTPMSKPQPRSTSRKV